MRGLIFLQRIMGLGKLLLRTYIFSFLLTIVLATAWSFIFSASATDLKAIQVIVLTSLLFNIPLNLIAFPGLFMSASFQTNKLKAATACFLAPVAILIKVATMAGTPANEMAFNIIIVISFILVLGYFFYKNLTPNNPRPVQP